MILYLSLYFLGCLFSMVCTKKFVGFLMMYWCGFGCSGCVGGRG